MIPVHDGLPSWCEHCNWGVKSDRTLIDDGFLARQYIRAGERYGRSLLESLKATSTHNLRPRWTLSKAIGFFVATCIHALTVVVIALGILLIATQYTEVLLLFLGIAMCIFGWMMRPQPGSVPTEDIVDRKEFPALYAFVDSIVRELGGRPVKHIVVNEDFNAYYAVVGWQRSSVLAIGLPLWTSLAPQERVALIAHEIAHGVNRDGTRNFIVSSALNALDGWISFLRAPYHHAVGVFEVLSACATWVLSYPFALAQVLLVQLLIFDKQKAEYFADYLASTISGTAAAVMTLQRLSSGEHLHDVLLKNAYSSSQSGASILHRFRTRIQTLPDREWQRLARAGQLEGARLDASHPPTAFRIEFLNAHQVTTPKVLATEASMSEIDRELSTLEERLGQRLIGLYARD